MKKNIIVSGSLAYDRIMDFPGYFSEHILPEKIHMLSVTFQVNSIKEKFGGTAGNIAYALSLLGERPVIGAAIGHDYKRYYDWFAKNGIATDSIKIIEDEFTASAYITTDKADNQITGFHPGAMKYSSALDFGSLNPQETIVTVSPGNLADMLNYPEICKAKGIDYIFDPGQALPVLDGEKLVRAIDGCRIMMANDYEIELISAKTGLNKTALLKLAKAIIVTQGEFGSWFRHRLRSVKSRRLNRSRQWTRRAAATPTAADCSAALCMARASKIARRWAASALLSAWNATAPRITGSAKKNSPKDSTEYSKIHD